MEYLQKLQQVQSYLNDKLTVPIEFIKNKLSIDSQKLPMILQAPLNFMLFFSSMFYFVIANADTFICNIVGITYPIMYCVHTLNIIPIPVDKIVTVNKYWILLGTLTILDPVLGYVPFYYYLKLISIYLMVKDDFLRTTHVFNCLESQHVRLEEMLRNYDEKELCKWLYVTEAVNEDKKIN
uniref:Uncharacterized protein n=1 Tax=viral metagenome TaxID=1070528 RepID=A0A6C0CA89_9ZZZZ